jgi:hypothetical protein
MSRVLRAIAITSALVTTNASAQVDGVDLNGAVAMLEILPRATGRLCLHHTERVGPQHGERCGPSIESVG